MQTNKTVISLVLAGLATGADTWYLLGTANRKNLWNIISGSVSDIQITRRYNDRSYQRKYAIDNLETAAL